MSLVAITVGVLCLATASIAEDVCQGHRCDTAACPCGCECGNDSDPGLCYVPKARLAEGLATRKALPTQMTAAQGNGKSCSKPDWTCVSERTVPVLSPMTGQVLLQMHGSSVNPVNVDVVEPGCELIPKPLGPCTNGTLGGDGSGTVVALGAGCSDFKVGDKVWGFMEGSYAQYAVADCKVIGTKPANLNFVDAGTIPVVGLTSLQCLKAAGMPSQKSNLTVVITSGQGGTGFMGVQLAKALGATRVITAATGSGIEFVKSLGADVVFDYHQQELSDALSNDSVDVVFDNFGRKGTADKMMHAIRTGGTFLVLMGGNGGQISQHPKAGVRQVPFGLMQPAREDLDQLKQFFEAGKLQPHTMQPTYSLAEVPQAFSRLRSSGVQGKLAVVPDTRANHVSTLTLV